MGIVRQVQAAPAAAAYSSRDAAAPRHAPGALLRRNSEAAALSPALMRPGKKGAGRFWHPHTCSRGRKYSAPHTQKPARAEAL
ncbi:MAG: hypothetical protein DBY17_08385 [Oscillospiraceae bacterium]|nr:MAG: hypothetical protein DBY17_08385 [Oscillospiraceae bacterium]